MNLVGRVRHLADFTCSLYEVVGLQTIVGRALNGQIVQVMGVDQAAGRLIVRLNPGDRKPEWKKLKLENFRPLPSIAFLLDQDVTTQTPSWEAFGSPCIQTLIRQKSELFEDLFNIERKFCILRQLISNEWAMPPLFKMVLQSIAVLLHHFNRVRIEAVLTKLDALERGVSLLLVTNAGATYFSTVEPSKIHESLSQILYRLFLVKWHLSIGFVFTKRFPTLGHSTDTGHLPSTSIAEEQVESSLVFDEVDHSGEDGAQRDEMLLSQQADHQWADDVERCIGSGSKSATGSEAACEDNVFIFPYTRTPAAFMDALLTGPDLKKIREVMQAHDCPYILEGSGAKVFVWPQQYAAVMHAVEDSGIELKASHVIAAESVLPCLEASIATIPSQKNVRVKKDGVLNLGSIPSRRSDLGSRASGWLCQRRKSASHSRLDETTPVDDGVRVDEDGAACPESTMPKRLPKSEILARRGLCRRRNSTTAYCSEETTQISDGVQEFIDDAQVTEDWMCFLRVERTFLCTITPVQNSNSVIQSTTEAHGGFNPRRVL